MSVLPTAAFIALTEISESVNDSSIKTNTRAPIAIVENIRAVHPGPIARRPQETRFGRQHPGTRHPVEVITVPSPVAWRPDVIRGRANWLHVNGERRWSDCNRHQDLPVRSC